MANLEHAEDEPKRAKMSGDVSADGGAAASAVSCAVPSFAAASALLTAPYSCLVTNAHRRHVCLSPMYMHKKRTGIRAELDGELLKFSHSLKGVPLAYDNISIVGQHGHIFDDSGYIHMNIEANFVVFQPKKGQKLLGMVNKLGIGHVGCLVHGCFNASIPRPNLVTVETWRVAGPRIGTELEFEVTSLDADAVGVLLIRGRMDRTRVQELLALGESSETSVAADQPEPAESEPNPEPTEEPPSDSPTKKKKKKKDKVKEEEMETEVTGVPPWQPDGSTTQELNGATDGANGNEAVEKKKKKKKKDKHPKEEEQEVEISPVDVHGSDSSGYLSDKPSKKRKHETVVASGVGGDPGMPKSKKKRKSDIE